MKRLIIVLILVIFAGAGFGYWWYLRDSPQKVLRDGIFSLNTAVSAGQLRADFAITDRKSGTTSGFSFLGELEAKDAIKVQLLGVVSIGAKTTTENDQSLDVVLTSEKIALRPRSVVREFQELAEKYTGDATGQTFILTDRDVFFDKVGYPAAVGKGKSDDVRSAFLYVLPALIPDGPIWKSDKVNGKNVSVNFRFDRSATAPFLIDLIRSWRKAASSVEEYAWINRASEGLVRGNFKMTLDQKSRQIVSLSGSWPMVDEQKEEIVRLNVALNFWGLNQAVSIQTPDLVKDITEFLSKRAAPMTLPSSTFRPGATTDTRLLIPRAENEIGGKKPEIDLFNKYSEELRKKSLN